jgi:predicted lipoprotein with Yx(FWY)xxD motif
MIRMILVLTLTATLGAIGFVAAGALAGNTTSQSNATISLRVTKLGKVLANSKGHTLYLFAKDRNGKSSCTAQCATYWPPLVKRGATTAGPGVKKSLIGVTKRSNGSLQVTYNKHPLYVYVLDKRAGQTTGQRVSAFGAKWYAVSASGKAVLKAPTGTTTSTTTTTSTYPTNPYP